MAQDSRRQLCLNLLLASFLPLFVELVFMRSISLQVYLVSFFKNIILLIRKQNRLFGLFGPTHLLVIIVTLLARGRISSRIASA